MAWFYFRELNFLNDTLCSTGVKHTVRASSWLANVSTLQQLSMCESDRRWLRLALALRRWLGATMTIKVFGLLGEELLCRRERGNAHDLFAVAVEKDGSIVRHILRKSRVCVNCFSVRVGRLAAE